MVPSPNISVNYGIILHEKIKKEFLPTLSIFFLTCYPKHTYFFFFFFFFVLGLIHKPTEVTHVSLLQVTKKMLYSFSFFFFSHTHNIWLANPRLIISHILFLNTIMYTLYIFFTAHSIANASLECVTKSLIRHASMFCCLPLQRCRSVAVFRPLFVKRFFFSTKYC